MKGANYILDKQVFWAKRNGISLVGSQITKGKLAYTKTLNENLFKPILPQVEEEIKNGNGGELRSNVNHSAKMFAVHSSSAIGVNVFQYWIGKNISNISYALGLCAKNTITAKEIHFEHKYKINPRFQFGPNIDVVIINDDSSKIKAYGIECKFSEAYSQRGHPGLKDKYILEINDLKLDMPNLFELANKISIDDKKFLHLHSAQLLKHILGLKNKYGKGGFKLLYLWYDVPGEESFKHSQEIEEFSKIAKLDEIKFQSIRYQELISKLGKEFYDDHKEYVDYLSNRYL